MIMDKTVVIDCFPKSAEKYLHWDAIVVVDIIRSTTTAITALYKGRRVFPARTTDDAFEIAYGLKKPLLAGELGGNMPNGFEVNNSPAEVALRGDIDRPMVLVSSSGTQLLLNTIGCSGSVYIACFRNLSAMAKHLAKRYQRVALLGAGTRGQFRREDQMGCAWIAEKLLGLGFKEANHETLNFIAKWKGAGPQSILGGKSAEYLRQSGQEKDLDFILQYMDDLDFIPMFINGEIIPFSGNGFPSFPSKG